MILDSYLLLADAQKLTATGASTSYIDTVAAGDANVGAWFVVRIGTACTSATALTACTFALQTDDSATFPSATTLLTTTSIAKASLTKDTEIFAARIPPGVQRYLRGYVTVTAGPLTAGSWDMFIVADKDINALLLA